MKITVVDASGREDNHVVSNQEEYIIICHCYGVRRLVNEEGLEVHSFVSLVEGGKYTLGPLGPPPQQQQQQPQQWKPPEYYDEVVAFVKEELENKTKHKPMSQVSVSFAEKILQGYGYSRQQEPVIKDPGTKPDPPPYTWTIIDSDGMEWDKNEHPGTQGARDWLVKNLLEEDDVRNGIGIKAVTGAVLPKLKANRHSASGKADLAIGDVESMEYSDVFAYVNGLIELKADKALLKTGQNVLELLALSQASSFLTGVALLVTDCNAKWEVFHISDASTIKHRVYKHGRKAWEDFMQLIKSAGDRDFKKLVLPIAESDEQDLDGFELDERDQKKMKAIADEAKLQRMAHHLGEIYGEDVTVPWWARAEGRVPDYYS